MAKHVDIVDIKQAINSGEMQAFVRDGSIYLKCKVSGECVKIGDAPAADVAPVVHGRWTTDGICNQCGCDIPPGEDTYCPNCGARMDGISNYDGN